MAAAISRFTVATADTEDAMFRLDFSGGRMYGPGHCGHGEQWWAGRPVHRGFQSSREVLTRDTCQHEPTFRKIAANNTGIADDSCSGQHSLVCDPNTDVVPVLTG